MNTLFDITNHGPTITVSKHSYLRSGANVWHYCLHIANKYGFKREVVLGSKDERFAFEMEVKLIKQYKTYEADWLDGSGWGANFTRGGEGSSGLIMSDEAKLKLSAKRIGENNPRYGKPVSNDTRQKNVRVT